MTSMTSQMATMWNAVHILQDAVLQLTNSSFRPLTIDTALMSTHPTLTVEGRDRFNSPGPTAPIPGYTDTETAPGPSVGGSILQGFRGRGSQGEPRTAGPLQELLPYLRHEHMGRTPGRSVIGRELGGGWMRNLMMPLPIHNMYDIMFRK
ncbi:hypothetical protein M405DRAFT_127937 [Rhizopogon salebrosus TDB-379]|nr:hypothetical protein M405DRAFT_127937 [Rhizopogon salebrosus TDB-379]